MNKKLEDNSELTKEILTSFHSQFSENQRNREQSFLKILTFLAVPVGAYAYVYHYLVNSSSVKNEHHVQTEELFLIQLISSILIFAGTWTIIAIANNFRRDQFVVAKIRTSCDLLGKNKIFPMSYNPLRSFLGKGVFMWMPDFLFIFYTLFVAVQFLLIGIFYFKIKPIWSIDDTNWPLTLAWCFPLILLALSVFVLPPFYRYQVVKVMTVNRDRYNIVRTYRRLLRCGKNRINSKDVSKSVPSNDEHSLQGK